MMGGDDTYDDSGVMWWLNLACWVEVSRESLTKLGCMVGPVFLVTDNSLLSGYDIQGRRLEDSGEMYNYC
jgi:hypothetical protein